MPLFHDYFTFFCTLIFKTFDLPWLQVFFQDFFSVFLASAHFCFSLAGKLKIRQFFHSFWGHINSKFVNLSYHIKSDQLFCSNLQDLWKPYLDWHHGLWWSGYWWQWNIPRYVAISSPTKFDESQSNYLDSASGDHKVDSIWNWSFSVHIQI
jgi:hypothetical protein